MNIGRNGWQDGSMGYPIGDTILSVALMLRYAFGLNDEAAAIETAVERTVGNGKLPADLGGKGGTQATTDQVLAQLAAL